MEQKTYRYYMTQRPFMPGAQPYDGLIGHEDLDPYVTVPEIGRQAWTMLTYDRELTDKELRDYELTPDRVTVIVTETKDMTALFREMHDGSWYTIRGAGGDLNDWITGYEGLMDKAGIGRPVHWVTFHGSDMNRELGLTGSNRYQSDLTFLAFPLDGLNIGKLAAFRLKMEDVWFDDMMENDLLRETFREVAEK